MDRCIGEEKYKKIEQNVKVRYLKTIGIILIGTLLLLSIGSIEVVNAQTPNPYFQLFNDNTLKIWNDATESMKNWAYGISESLKDIGITKNDFDMTKKENIRTENPNRLVMTAVRM